MKMIRYVLRIVIGGSGISVVALGGMPTDAAAQAENVASGAMHSAASRGTPHRQSGTYQTVTVTEGASLTGRVLFTGDTPAPRRLLITKDVEVCGEGYRERHDVVVGNGGGLQNVVVFIEGIEEGKAWPDAGQGHALDQVNCEFSPHLQVIPSGSDLDIINSDPVLHNIHTYELIGRARRTLFNFGQPPDRGTITRAIRPRRGNQIRLECDAHDFMLGWIYATDSPYYAVVGTDGRFDIADIPPGTYAVKAWHPFLGIQEQEVTLGAGGADEITFQFSGR